MSDTVLKPFVSASRKEVECELRVKEGEIPTDLYGHVFFNSTCGTVNSAVDGHPQFPGLPIPEYYPDNTSETNREFGANLFNGDALLLRFDFNQKGKVCYKSSILKTPCYYADLATKRGTKWYDEGHEFKMMGIARQSWKFGSRNQLNTAVSPFRFKGDTHSRMTASFDMGRPWELDVDTMKLKTPIGSYKQWTAEFGRMMTPYPFQLFQTTAHPAFDPLTQEYFSVNFTKSLTVLFFGYKFTDHVKADPEKVEKSFHKHVNKVYEGDHKDKAKEINKFYKRPSAYVDKDSGIWGKIKYIFWTIVAMFIEFFFWIADLLFDRKNNVYLLKWDGEEVHSWRVVDKDTGKGIVIQQCMHQNNICKDYIILSDSALKFAADIMITNPFPHNYDLDRKLREMTTHPQLPTTPLYVIKRSDLDKNNKTVPAFSVTIDLETVHFSPNYDNPDGIITLHTAHNAACCAAEWIRPYDQLVTEEERAPYENTIGLMCCGEMDIGRIGKFTIDANAGKLVGEELIYLTGHESQDNPFVGFKFEGGADELRAHTWGVALHTYRDIISDTNVVDHVNQIYWQCYGTDPRYLTKFIEQLYIDYPNRIIPVEELVEMNKKKLPYCLLRQDTNKMTVEDYYLFEFNKNLRSMQFVPRDRRNQDTSGIDLEMDGYIVCTMVNGPEDFADDNYSRELWIFDAANLKQGPVCKLTGPQMNFAFTIHSTWMEDVVSQDTTYQVDIKKDLEFAIKKYVKSDEQKEISGFMKEHVYPYF
ncbi:MAG: hypothetical protein HKN09_07490 [Saprospiraceae bacterium]|nr:hypothetical protein [Saprospiraceae bacterium]